LEISFSGEQDQSSSNPLTAEPLALVANQAIHFSKTPNRGNTSPMPKSFAVPAHDLELCEPVAQ
jgi:hypothetical protein